MNPYNGFPGWFRIQAGAALYEQSRAGTLTLDACTVCGDSSTKLMIHLEDYENLTEYRVICRRCHMTLHKRFNQPHVWTRLLASIADGSCTRQAPGHVVPRWALDLLLTEVDLREGRPPLVAPEGGSNTSGSAVSFMIDRARAKKAHALADHLAWAGVAPDDARAADGAQWAAWARQAGTRVPSATTIDAAVALLEEDES